MENQYCIIPIGRLKDVDVDLIGVKTYANFQVIDIIGDRYLYWALLGIDWAFEKYEVIELKRETMNFEVDGMWVIQPLDPYQDSRFTEPVDNLSHLIYWTNYINWPLGGKKIILTPRQLVLPVGEVFKLLKLVVMLRWKIDNRELMKFIPGIVPLFDVSTRFLLRYASFLSSLVLILL